MSTMTRGTANDLFDEFLRMRQAGNTYREIGLRHGLSHERVRQVLSAGGADTSCSTRPSARELRAGEVARVTEWLQQNGPVTRAQLCAALGITSARLSLLLAEGVPGHLLLVGSRPAKPLFSDDDVVRALRTAWERARSLDPGVDGLSHAMYEILRCPTDPSAPMMVSRYGWEKACRIADIPHGAAWRAKDSYHSRWTDDDILTVLRRYLDHCRVASMRPTYLGYERWQQANEDAPSGTLVRNRCRQMGYRTWVDTVQALYAD